MRKLILGIMVVTLCFVVGCSQKSYEGSSITQKESEAIVINYLYALSEKDVELLKEFGTKEYTDAFNEEGIELLKTILEYASLIKCEIRESDNKRAIVDAKVEVVCYENSSPSGDWVPGKTISQKSFELVNVDGEWKVNGWGVY